MKARYFIKMQTIYGLEQSGMSSVKVNIEVLFKEHSISSPNYIHNPQLYHVLLYYGLGSSAMGWLSMQRLQKSTALIKLCLNKRFNKNKSSQRQNYTSLQRAIRRNKLSLLVLIKAIRPTRLFNIIDKLLYRRRKFPIQEVLETCRS